MAIDEPSFSLRIADIGIQARGASLAELLLMESAYSAFAADGVPDVTISVRSGPIPAGTLTAEAKVFDTGSMWTLYRIDGRHAFSFQSPALGVEPYRIGIFDAEYKHCEVFLRKLDPAGPHARAKIYPLERPLLDLAVVSVLARKPGIVLHACGIGDQGKGYLFAGHSEDGKTTLSNLLGDKCLVLNDERVAVRPAGSTYRLYGTPWHGESPVFSPDSVPLSAIFILKKSGTNKARVLGGPEACASLVARGFVPMWDRDLMAGILDFTADLVGNVPCFEISFSQDGPVLEFIRSIVRS